MCRVKTNIKCSAIAVPGALLPVRNCTAFRLDVSHGQHGIELSIYQELCCGRVLENSRNCEHTRMMRSKLHECLRHPLCIELCLMSDFIHDALTKKLSSQLSETLA